MQTLLPSVMDVYMTLWLTILGRKSWIFKLISRWQISRVCADPAERKVQFVQFVQFALASVKTMKNSCKWKINAHKPKDNAVPQGAVRRAQHGQNRNTFHAVFAGSLPQSLLPPAVPAWLLCLCHEISINYAKMFVVFALFLLPSVLSVFWLHFTCCFIQICVHFLFAK